MRIMMKRGIGTYFLPFFLLYPSLYFCGPRPRPPLIDARLCGECGGDERRKQLEAGDVKRLTFCAPQAVYTLISVESQRSNGTPSPTRVIAPTSRFRTNTVLLWRSSCSIPRAWGKLPRAQRSERSRGVMSILRCATTRMESAGGGGS